MTTRPSPIVEDGPIERQFAEDRDQRSGLTFVVKAGLYVDGITVTNIAETSLSLTDDVISVVYLNIPTKTILNATLGSEAKIDMIPLFEVTTASGAITAVTDNRKIVTVLIES